MKANRQRDFGEAQWWLTSTAKRIRKYAGSDPELRALVAELEAEAQRFAAPMPAMVLKEAHFNASNMARSRDGPRPRDPASRTVASGLLKGGNPGTAESAASDHGRPGPSWARIRSGGNALLLRGLTPGLGQQQTVGQQAWGWLEWSITSCPSCSHTSAAGPRAGSVGTPTPPGFLYVSITGASASIDNALAAGSGRQTLPGQGIVARVVPGSLARFAAVRVQEPGHAPAQRP